MAQCAAFVGFLWRYLLVVDFVASIGLFFAVGFQHEETFVADETDAANWDGTLLDLPVIAAARCIILGLVFYRLEKMALMTVKYAMALSVATASASLSYTVAKTVVLARSNFAPLQATTHGFALALMLVGCGLSALELGLAVAVPRCAASAAQRRALRARAAVNNDEDDGPAPAGAGGVSGKKSEKSVADLWRLALLAREELGLIVVGCVMLGIAAGTNILAPLYFGKVVDAAAGDHKSGHRLGLAVLDLALVYLGGAIASMFRDGLFSLAGQKMVARLRKRLFKAIVDQEIAFFDTTRTGELTNRLASDTQVIQDACTSNISMLLRYLAQIFGSVGVMFSLSWKLTFVLLSVVPPVAIGAVLYGKRLKVYRKLFQDRLADASTTAEETIGNIRTVRSFSNEFKATAAYSKNIDGSFQVGRTLSFVTGGFSGATSVLASAAILLVLWYGGTQVLHGKLSAGLLTSFMLYTLTVAMAFAFLASLYGEFMQAVGASVRLFELMDKRPLINPTGGVVPSEFVASIQLDHVSFTYPSRPDTRVLEGISLEVVPGTAVALVGPSGGGKSTCISLIERFYDPCDGHILIGGTPLKLIDPAWLRRHMSLVSQEPTLFAASIADNIRYGCEAASLDDVQMAARQANCHGFIESFQDGYDTLVGERGVRLSGGQKQRVAIARALLMNPKILLLDEATSALDAESEHLVQEAIDRLMTGRTVVVIAHRLSTVRNATRVVVIEGGRLCESGTHNELLALDGTYKKLVQRQLVDSAGAPAATPATASLAPAPVL